MVLGPGIPGLGSWALNQELQAHVRYEPGGARRSGWIQEQGSGTSRTPPQPGRGPGSLPSRASRGRRRRFSGAWEGESGARGPSAEKNLLRSSLHAQRGRGSVVTSRPFCAANRLPWDLAWTLPCPGGQSRDRGNPLPCAGLPTVGLPRPSEAGVSLPAAWALDSDGPTWSVR